MREYLNKNFLLLLIGQFISVIGDRISTAVFITIAVTIVNNTQTSFQSSLILVVQVMPIFLFGYFFGLLADNFRKKSLMIIADIGRILILIFFFFFHSSLIILYVCIFLLGTFTSMFEPSKKSIIPFLVKKKDLVALNKIYAIMEIFAMLIGLGVGAFLLEIIGINEAILLDLGTYVFSLSLILFLKYKDNTETKNLNSEITKTKKGLANFKIELKEGFIYLKSNLNSLTVISNLVIPHFFAVGIFFSTVTDLGIRTSQELGLNAGSNVSFFLFLVAIGALFSPIFKKASGNLKDSTLSEFVFYFGALISFLISIITIYSKNFILLYILLLFIGLVAGIQYIRFLYLLHLNTEKKFMGRVVSIAEIIIGLVLICGVLIGSYINEILTYKYGFLTVGIIYLLGGISFIFVKKKISW